MATAAGDREYTITPALIGAVGRRETNADIDRHDVAGLATALTYVATRERGEIIHRLMAEDLDISPLAAELILQALRPRRPRALRDRGSWAGLDTLGVDEP